MIKKNKDLQKKNKKIGTNLLKIGVELAGSVSNLTLFGLVLKSLPFVDERASIFVLNFIKMSFSAKMELTGFTLSWRFPGLNCCRLRKTSYENKLLRI